MTDAITIRAAGELAAKALAEAACAMHQAKDCVGKPLTKGGPKRGDLLLMAAASHQRAADQIEEALAHLRKLTAHQGEAT